jgi:peptide/nickel transport system permease protein
MSVLVVAIGASIGVAVGVVSGFLGGWVDEVLMRVVDLFLSLPGFVLALALAAALGRGETSVVIALSIVWWPSYARLIRGMVLGMKHRLHVESARALGAGPFRIAMVHILPFMWGQLNARVTQDLGYALVNVAGLSFIGLGAQPPTPEWGALLESGLQYVVNGWWLTVFPGLAITLWTLGVAMLGDGLSGFARSERGGSR